MPPVIKRKEHERTGWACNRCNLVTRQQRHPGYCNWCQCPEHRILYTVEEMDQIEETRKRFIPETAPHDRPKLEQGRLFDDEN